LDTSIPFIQSEFTGNSLFCGSDIYLEHVYIWFRAPKKIISNRDPCFTSHFAKALAKHLGMTQNISTAFHPQTDGASERANQWLEQYICLIAGEA